MFSHRVQFYDSDAFLVKTVLDFVEPARCAGSGVIVIATREHLGALQAMLGTDPGARRSEGRDHWVFLDARETLATFMVDGLPDERRFADVVGGLMREVSDNGNRHVSAFGEMVAVLYAEGNAEAAIRLEQLWENLAQHHRFSLLCAYPLSAFPDDGHRAAFQCICAAHSHVNPIERLDEGTDPQELHRTIALLQQQANSLKSELLRRKDSERLLDSQDVRIAVKADGVHACGLQKADGNPALLTVEAAAGRLLLSRPHVLKLIAERRLEYVISPDGGTPLIPAHEVSRVAREMQRT